ncbi:MAG: hypothetical protein AAFV53_28880 [Myxococcota bacterium]
MALCTAAQVRTASQGDTIPDDAATTAHIDALIASVGALFAVYCGYPPASPTASPTMESASYTRHTGDSGVCVDPDNTRLLFVEPYPVTAATVYQDLSESFTTAIDSSAYDIRGDLADHIRLKPTSSPGEFYTAEGVIRITFTAGFTADSPPDDLNRAAVEAVLFFYDLESRRGRQSTADGQTGGSLTTTFRPEDLPDHVVRMLNPYRLPSALV